MGLDQYLQSLNIQIVKPKKKKKHLNAYHK